MRTTDLEWIVSGALVLAVAPPQTQPRRTDVDGLRAVAVCAVILGHAGFPTVGGGFLGVDVFFVISGFLIHGNISRDLDASRFDLRAFYERRLRRTVPALFAVILATLAAGYFICMPGEFIALAKSATASALSISNVFFLNEVGYFDHDALTKPLLHTWSLGVEEQFYLIAPLLSLTLARTKSGLRPRLPLGGLIIFCFVACIGVQRLAPAAAFYLMPTRLWEFLLGYAIADQVVPRIRIGWLAEVVTLASLAGLGGAFVLCSDASPHPGVATLIPCVATAAIIHVGSERQTIAGRLLDNPVAQFLGLISYSLYLWHWPLVVFAADQGWPRTWQTLAPLGLLLVVLSALSWRFIEQPFRNPASMWRQRAVPAFVGSGAAILVVSTAILADRGVPARFGADVMQVTSYFDYEKRRNIREGSCFISSKYASLAAFDKGRCLALSSTKPNYLIIGDSLAAHLWIGLSAVMTDRNVMQATASGCTPTLDPVGKRYCTDLMDYILGDFIQHNHIDGIIFSGGWTPADVPRLEKTIPYVRRFVRNVFVIGPNPAYDMDLPNLLGRSIVTRHPDMALQHQSNEPWQMEAMLRSAVGDKTIVSQLDLLCPDHRCVTTAGKNVPFQYDKSHMTSEGSLLVAHRYEDVGAFAPSETVSKAER